MSSNDDSASRRGRRADQAEPDWRAANRSGNQSPNQKPRDAQPQNAAYSGFSRQSYSQQQPYSPPRQEPPPLAQPSRSYDAPQVPQGYYPEPAPQAPRAPEPPQGYYQEPVPQAPRAPEPPLGYYQEPAPRYDPPRSYVEPASPYAPPPSPYDAGPQHTPYGGTGGELFGRDPSAQSYEQNPYGAGSGYRPEPYDPVLRPPLQPREDERPFAPRIPQESSAPRYYADEQPQRSAPPLTQQPALDRGYPQQHYSPAAYDQPPVQHESYQRGGFEPQFPAGEDWNAAEDHYPGDEMRSGHPPLAAHGDDFDEEFPDEDFDGEDYGAPQKGGRKKLFAALLLGAATVVVGGAYGYKMLSGEKGETATPLIHADRTPSKEVPDKPGGRQYPHGEKAIYDRLTSDGRTQVASAPVAAAAIAPQAFAAAPAPAPGGSSLEQRIDEALRRATGTSDAAGGRPGTEQPTVVRSEAYRPDGTRVDARPVITPSIVSVDNGLPYPFGNAAAPAPGSQPAAAPFKAAPLNFPAQPQSAAATAPAAGKAAPIRTASRAPAAEPAAAIPAAAGGFYVSLKSAPDERAIQRDIPALTEKYKSVLGDVQIQAKIADLGAKGITYRAVAGPLGTKQEAMELCTKIKGVGGDKACFVTN
ncbi:MAG: hypothetical protein ACLPX9_09500 [Rhodomicrobium sp.]